MTSFSRGSSAARSPASRRHRRPRCPGCARGVIPRVAREIAVRRVRVVCEKQVVGIAELAGHRLRARVQQEFGVVEAQAPLGPVFTAHLVRIELAGPQAAHQRVPDVLVRSRSRITSVGSPSGESKSSRNTSTALREYSEVHPACRRCGAQRKTVSSRNCLRGSMLQLTGWHCFRDAADQRLVVH